MSTEPGVSSPQLREYADEDLPETMRAAIREMVDDAWPTGEADPTGPLHDPALRPWWMLLVLDGVPVASLAVLTKRIEHAGHAYQAAGLSGVVTRVAHRGQRLGHQLVVAARQRMAVQGLDLGIFTCDRPLRGFYESAGWHCLPGTVLDGGTVDEPLASDRPGFDKVTLADFFSPAARRHREDFVGVRVALYPGSIDKLW